MITRCLNIALMTHDTNVSNFLCRVLRYILIDPNYLRSFGALESQEIVLMEFKSQFFKEFGVIYNDGEPLINPYVAYKNIEPLLTNYEQGQWVLSNWLTRMLTQA